MIGQTKSCLWRASLGKDWHSAETRCGSPAVTRVARASQRLLEPRTRRAVGSRFGNFNLEAMDLGLLLAKGRRLQASSP